MVWINQFELESERVFTTVVGWSVPRWCDSLQTWPTSVYRCLLSLIDASHRGREIVPEKRCQLRYAIVTTSMTLGLSNCVLFAYYRSHQKWALSSQSDLKFGLDCQPTQSQKKESTKGTSLNPCTSTLFRKGILLHKSSFEKFWWLFII